MGIKCKNHNLTVIQGVAASVSSVQYVTENQTQLYMTCSNGI